MGIKWSSKGIVDGEMAPRLLAMDAIDAMSRILSTGLLGLDVNQFGIGLHSLGESFWSGESTKVASHPARELPMEKVKAAE